MKTLYDAAYPPAIEPKVDGVGFYIGGNTPHVWTPQELGNTKVRYRLPIFTASIASNPVTSCADARAALGNIKAPSGIAIAFDLETRIDVAFINQVKLLLHDYYVLTYGSLAFVTKNPSPWWVADWDGVAAIDSDDPAGTVAVQYGGHPGYDLSVFSDVVPLWDTHAVVISPGLPSVKEDSVISFNDANGNPCIAGKAADNGNLLVFTLVNGKWQVMDVTNEIHGIAPGDPRLYKLV